MQLTPAVMYGVFVAGTTVAVLLLAYLLYRHLSKTAGPMEVCALYIYPVKSCAGIQLTECQFDRLGFQHDRRFVVLNSETGNMVSQREYPQMALITPKIDAASNTLTLSFPGEKEVIELPLETKQGEKDTKEAKVTVWDDTIQSRIFTSPSIPAWFTRILKLPEGRKLTIATTLGTQEHHRPMQPTFDRTPEVGVHPSFGDQAPFLLTTEESLAAVNKWTRPAGRVVTQKCFRPNIVLRNAVGGAWKEDFWRRIRIGPEARGADGGRTLRDAHKAGELSSEFWVAKAAPRCILTTVIPEEGRFHPSGEPLLSLRSHRKVLPHIPSQSDGAFFGQLLMPLKSTGSVRVGDRVTVTAAREKMFDPVREKVQEQDKQAVEEQDRKEEEGGNKKQSKQNKAKKDE